MPYKASGRWVLVKRKGRWVKFKQHDNPAEAEKHVAALRINVYKKKKRRRK